MRAFLRIARSLALWAAWGFSLLSLSLLSPSFASSNADCYEAIRSHLIANDPAATKKFFQLQAKLTLHRLAWAHLKAAKTEKSDGALPSLESTLTEILGSIEASRKDAAFNAAEKTFHEAPLSRRALSDVLDSLRRTLKAQNDLPETTQAFRLHLEDIRLLAVLGEVEASPTNSAGRFVRDPKDPRSVLNLIKLVDSAYRGLNATDLDREIRTAKSEIDRIEKSLAPYADQALKIARENPACQGTFECPDCAANGDSVAQRSQALDLLLRSLNDELKRSGYTGLRYGEVWLRTGGRPNRGTRLKSSTAHQPSPGRPAEPPSRSPSKSDVPIRVAVPTGPFAPLEYGFDPRKTEASRPHHPSAAPLEGQQMKAIQRSLKSLNSVRACLAKDFPALNANYDVAVRAFALYRAESNRASLETGSFSNLLHYFSSSLQVAPNPYRDRPELCPELRLLKDQGQEKERREALEALGTFRFWSENTDGNSLKDCPDLRPEEKLLLPILVKTGRLTEAKVRNCALTDKIRKGLATYRTFSDGIFTLPVNR